MQPSELKEKDSYLRFLVFTLLAVIMGKHGFAEKLQE
jgi:hypothetical protein